MRIIATVLSYLSIALNDKIVTFTKDKDVSKVLALALGEYTTKCVF